MVHPRLYHRLHRQLHHRLRPQLHHRPHRQLHHQLRPKVVLCHQDPCLPLHSSKQTKGKSGMSNWLANFNLLASLEKDISSATNVELARLATR